MKANAIAKQRIKAKRQAAEQTYGENMRKLTAEPAYDAKDTQVREQILITAKAIGTESEKAERAKLAKLRAELQETAASLGFSAEATAPQYSCKLCNDRGVINGKYCKCLQEEIRKIIYEKCQIYNPLFTFEKSTDDSKAYTVLKEWCEKYPDSKYKNILFSGKTGVGKTYLCSCVANALVDKQVDVLFITAYNLNQKFLQVHTADIADKEDLADSYEEVDVLIIDDLGAEPILKNVTEEYFFALINERISAGKCTIVSTNLDVKGIVDRYGERFLSRISDKEKSIVINLGGNDKRINK